MLIQKMDVANTFRKIPVDPDDAAAFGHVLMSSCACATFWLRWLFPAALGQGGVRLAPTRLLAPQPSADTGGDMVAAFNSPKAKNYILCSILPSTSAKKKVLGPVFRSPKVEFCVWALSKAYLVAFIYAPGISGTIDNPTTDVHNIYKELVCFI